MSLSIEPAGSGERTRALALRGDMDYANVQIFRDAVSAILADGRCRVLVVDLGGVSFLDSNGVGILVVASRICADVGVRLELRAVNPFIARLFAVLGVSDALGVPIPAGVVAPRRPATAGAGAGAGAAAGAGMARGSVTAWQ